MRLHMQTSLRAMLALVTVSAVLIAYWDAEAKTQQSVADAILKAGGRVTYSPAPQFVPNFALDTIGQDYFCQIGTVTFYPTTAAECDEQLNLLRQLPDLRRLAIWPGSRGLQTAPKDPPGGLTDEGLDFLLTHLRHLEHLSLIAARLTPDAQHKLQSAERIKSLQYEIHSSFGGGYGGR